MKRIIYLSVLFMLVVGFKIQVNFSDLFRSECKLPTMYVDCAYHAISNSPSDYRKEERQALFK